jgi:putative ABC transport system permease protein
LDNLLQDLRYGLRVLAARPAFTLIAMVALALGIGANTAIFSVVNAVLLRPLPYPEADRLLIVWHTYPQSNLPRATISPPSYAEYRDTAGSFDQVAAITPWSVNLTGSGSPERLQGVRATSNFLSTLGDAPSLGRDFLAEEDQPGNNRVVVLTHGLWQRRFGGDPAIVGSTIELNKERYTVVGVTPAGMPRSFTFLSQIDLFTPIAFTAEDVAPNRHGYEYLLGVARLKHGVSVGQAQAEIDRVADRLRADFYESGWGIILTPLREQLVGDIRPALWILLGSVGCVLLIACANVANLLLARAASRQREISIRTALGAGRWRVVRQLLTESALLALAGGALGLLLAFLGVRLLAATALMEIGGPAIEPDTVAIDPPVLAFTLIVALLTGLLFGLVPALQASRPDVVRALNEGGRSAAIGASGHRLLNLFVVCEMAIAMVLLIAAGLLIRSFVRLQGVDPGFRSAGVLTVRVSLPPDGYQDGARVAAFYRQVVERIAALPGVGGAAVIDNVPMGGNNQQASFDLEGMPSAPGEPGPHGDTRTVSPGYFSVMGIPLLQGRLFDSRDSEDALPVAVIDETLARRYWPDGDPIGQRIAAGWESRDDTPRWRQIVGVVGHTRQYGLDGLSKFQYYFPQEQSPRREMAVVVRAASNPLGLVAAIRRVVADIDPNQPIYAERTMQQILAGSLAARRFSMLLLSIFAAVALLLAAVGIYGVMSYSVTQRTRELGVRMALGASTGDVLRLVVRQGLTLALIGLGLGIGAALALSRVLVSLLFEVTATDPATFAGLSTLLVLIAAVACLVPALRAARVDPVTALRHE